MDQEQPPSRRDRQIAARRAQILKAAARVFAEKGFHHTTTKEIAQVADLSEGTIYNYFDNKTELLISMVRQVAQQEEQKETEPGAGGLTVRGAFQREVYDRLKRSQDNYEMLAAILTEILDVPELGQLYYKELLEPVMRRFEAQAGEWSGSREAGSYDARLAARVFCSLFVGLQILQALGDEVIVASAGQPAELTEMLTQLFVDGMGLERA
jgi:AcrR family transcriptional regulator